MHNSSRRTVLFLFVLLIGFGARAQSAHVSPWAPAEIGRLPPVAGLSDGVRLSDTPATVGRTYYRVEVTGPSTPYPQVPGSIALSGNMVGLSNPIYFNFDPNF